MEHQVTIPHTDFLRSPLGIAALMLVSSVGGGYLKDRLSTETRDVSSAVRVDALDRRLSEHLTDAVSKRQYEDAEATTQKRLDDIRQDVRDLKLEIESSLIGVPLPRRMTRP